MICTCSKASGTPVTPSSTHLHLFHHIPSSSLDWLNRSVQGEDIGIQIVGCYYEQMSPLASKGNGTSRPTLTPGAKQHTTTGLPRGQRAGGTASTRRSPSPLLRGRISPTNTATSSFGSQILT
ncbi:Citrate synthase-lysine N-methyltransferase CSKMT mitochondrial, partial [Dissostichus eleginoides]